MGKYVNKECNPREFSTIVLMTYSAIVGLIHGIGEILQAGNNFNSNFFNALDVADPNEVWHAGLPAFSLIPNFLISGIITVLIGVVIVIFANFLINSKYFKFSPLLFIMLFLFGGGFVPPFIGIVSSTYYFIKNRSNTNSKQPSLLRKLIAKSWIYLISFLILWLPTSWIIGSVFPVFRLQISSVTFILFDIILPILILVAASIKYGIVDRHEFERL